jgi:D-alanyl-D-alanine carboxypeptidase
MTIGQLLHHTAGLPDHVHLPAFQQAWADLATREDRFDPEGLVRFVSGLDPLFEPGTGWAYSDTAMSFSGW